MLTLRHPERLSLAIRHLISFKLLFLIMQPARCVRFLGVVTKESSKGTAARVSCI
jgi:hypothetical protein